MGHPFSVAREVELPGEEAQAFCRERLRACTDALFFRELTRPARAALSTVRKMRSTVQEVTRALAPAPGKVVRCLGALDEYEKALSQLLGEGERRWDAQSAAAFECALLACYAHAYTQAPVLEKHCRRSASPVAKSAARRFHAEISCLRLLSLNVIEHIVGVFEILFRNTKSLAAIHAAAARYTKAADAQAEKCARDMEQLSRLARERERLESLLAAQTASSPAVRGAVEAQRCADAIDAGIAGLLGPICEACRAATEHKGESSRRSGSNQPLVGESREHGISEADAALGCRGIAALGAMRRAWICEQLWEAAGSFRDSPAEDGLEALLEALRLGVAAIRSGLSPLGVQRQLALPRVVGLRESAVRQGEGDVVLREVHEALLDWKCIVEHQRDICRDGAAKAALERWEDTSRRLKAAEGAYHEELASSQRDLQRHRELSDARRDYEAELEALAPDLGVHIRLREAE